MKILHLADLHIGKMIYEQSLLEDQKYMLQQIIEIVEQEKIEAVLIAGDIYDRSVPPGEAVEVLNDFLNTLIKQLKVKVFMIAGNHDSKERLNFGSRILENDGLYIQTNYDGQIRKVALSDQINVYLLPFLKPIEVRPYFPDEKIENYNDAMKCIMQNETIDSSKINLLMAHQFMTNCQNGPERCDSEVTPVGGIENVEASNFDAFDYVALGHIHGPQRIGKDTIRYAGTMLKYSFSEVNHHKSAVMITIDETTKQLDYALLPLKPLRDMRVLKGPIQELLKPENYQGTNTDDYIKAILTNSEAIYDAIGQMRKVYPHTLSLEIENCQTSFGQEEWQKLEKIKKKSEFELFEDFYQFQNNRQLDEEQTKMVQDAIQKVKE